jgi:PAS domain S-box-containing protein
MGLHNATRLNRWFKSAEAKTLHAGRLNIGPRLILGFVFIILSMLAADAIILWQFHVVRTQAGHLNDVDQKLVAVLRVHTSMLEFHDRLDALADAEDANRLAIEAGPLRTMVLEDIRRATSAVSLPSFDFRRDPTILPTLHVIQSALSSQLDAITTLAASGDWRAVHLRLANQVRPLESLTSALVEKVDHEAAEQQAQTVLNIRRVQRLVFWIVPLTAVFTLLIAATLGLATTRSITQPLARLVEGSKALSRGEFQHQVSVTGKDELAHLGQVFNDTARRLRDLYATLQSSEDRLRLVIDTIPAHVWSARPEGSIDFINRRWLETTGLAMEDALGWDWGRVVHPDDLARYVDEWRAALAAGESMESEVRLRQADGKYRWWLTRNVPLRDEVGSIIKWYGTAIDIEERKCAEEALREAQANLARVSRVTTMGELTASLAHEIRQPIAAAVTNAKTCLRWLGRDQPNMAEAREAAARIIKDVTRASDIISRIRLLFKKGPPQRESLDVNEVIQEMIALLRSEANRYSISIRGELANDLPNIMADRVQLQQVLMNLMLNGIEAMKDMGNRGELTIKSQQDDNHQLLISVVDAGMGLQPEQAEQIFNAFYTTKPQGTGMGLPISRSIIESHGGRLWATSNSGPGATFQFTLPSEVSTHQAA